MSRLESPSPHVAIACGGTGGHLFPGIAVGREVLARGGRVTLFISEKEVDRQAVASVRDMQLVTLPSVGLTRGRVFAFVTGLLRSRRRSIDAFKGNPPQVVLAMGGFTSAGPVLAGRRAGAACFLHDSNVIPGRANRWLARFADEIFVAFEAAQSRLKKPTRVTGTPVRPEFFNVNRDDARTAMGLRSNDPVLLIMGGSQGASGINRLAREALPKWIGRFPNLQFIHLAGATDLADARAAYRGLDVKALVQDFCSEMHHALGAATLVISRAGGSSLAEIAATHAPSVLIPYPQAADQHQSYNAKAFADQGAAIVLDQGTTNGSILGSTVIELLDHPDRLKAMRERLSSWQSNEAAERIVDAMFVHLSAELSSNRRPRQGRSEHSSNTLSALKPFNSAAS